MPNETQEAVNWALTQNDSDGNKVTKDMSHWVSHYVRQYFNDHNIVYQSFSYEDLIPFL
jgi:hypothetical protein